MSSRGWRRPTGVTTQPSSSNPVVQLRLVVEAHDFDEAVSFYRDVLGLPEEAAFEGSGSERVVILQAGRATLELANPAQHRMIDDVEVGSHVAPKFRVAFEVADSVGATSQRACTSRCSRSWRRPPRNDSGQVVIARSDRSMRKSAQPMRSSRRPSPNAKAATPNDTTEVNSDALRNDAVITVSR